jgi:hypothetical protein
MTGARARVMLAVGAGAWAVPTAREAPPRYQARTAMTPGEGEERKR